MKKVLLLAVVFYSSMTIFAQETAKTEVLPVSEVKTAENKPVTEVLFIKDDVYDFGKIPQGKPVHTVFTVKNISQQPLKIANVQASCGCTTPEWDKENAIPAGQDSKITVGYNAAAEGPFSKVITVTYNETGSKQITIKGEVWKTPAASAPENNSLNDLKNK